jgi:hypothetical protein
MSSWSSRAFGGRRPPLAQDPGPVILRSVAWVERDLPEPTINMHIDDSRGRLVLCLLVPAAKKAAYRRLYAALQGAVDRSLAEIEGTKLPPAVAMTLRALAQHRLIFTRRPCPPPTP